MLTIHKYALKPALTGEPVQMPAFAKPLYVGLQEGEPYVWAKVSTLDTFVPTQFDLYGTGAEIDHPGRYLGTLLMHGGALVFHVLLRNRQLCSEVS